MTRIDGDRELAGHDARPRYLKRIDVRAAVLVAAVFNAILGVAFTLAGWLVVAIAAQRGFLDQINSVTSDLNSGHQSGVSALRLCLIWALIVTFWAITMTVVVGLATLIFNGVLQLLGGIELDLRASRPERVDAAALVRGVAQSVRAKLQSRAPRPALGSGRAASAVQRVTGTAPMSGRAVTHRSGPATVRPQDETVTSR